MSQEFQREYLIRLPLPLAQLYQRAYNDKSAQSRHNNTFYLFEALIKLATAPAVAAYLQEIDHGAPHNATLDGLLVHLALPSLGQWVGMLRALARHFGTRPEAAAHPLGHLWDQLNRPYRDRPGLLALYRRIKNGLDGEPAGDQSCTPMQVLDSLVPYRNAVFGHGAGRFESFYEQEMGPLLFPAANELLSDGILDLLGPRGSRLVHLAELRIIDEDRLEVGLRELVGERSARAAPLILSRSQAAGLAQGPVAVLWPGRPLPLRLDPLLLFREGELGDEVLFLNRDRNGRQVEYLSYTRGEPERDRATAPALASLLGRVIGRNVSTEQLEMFSQQTMVETPTVEILLGPSPIPARVLGDYEIIAEIGRGGMGVVYLARQLSLGRLVALKMLPADLAGDEVTLARFRREMRLLARCDHPNIVKVLASGTLPDGQLYYAMEYVPGSDLEQVWRELAGSDVSGDTSTLSSSTWTRAVLSASRKVREQSSRRPAATESSPLPLPPLPELPSAPDDPRGYARRVAALIRDAALALQAVHDQQVVHRDVKPANLMLSPDGARVVLMDFGLAKGQETEMAASRAGGLLGTLRYAAPEQLAAANLRVGPAADVRGLGVTLWELLTRRRLFAEAEDERQLATIVHEQDVPRLRSIDAGIDRDLEAIVARATERRVSDRISKAGQLAEYLQLYLENKTLPIRPPTIVELVGRWAGRNRAVLGSVTTLLIFAATIAVATKIASDLRFRRLQAEVEAEVERGNTALLNENAKDSQVLLAGAIGKIGSEPRLLTTRQRAEGLLAEAERRLLAQIEQQRDRARLATFMGHYDDALLHGTLFTGRDSGAAQAKASAWKALEVFGSKEDSASAVPLDLSTLRLEDAEKGRVKACCYELLMLLALFESPAGATIPASGDRPTADLKRAGEFLDRAARLIPEARQSRLLSGRAPGEPAAPQVAHTGKSDLFESVDHFLIGLSRYYSQDLKQAGREFERTLQAYPDHYWSQYFLGLCHLKARRWGEARIAFSGCLSRKPRSPWPLMLRGYVAGEMLDFEAAESDFGRAMELAPDEYDILVNRAAMRIRRGKFAEASDDLRRAIERDPRQYQAYANLARVFSAQERRSEAIEQLDQAIRRAPRVALLHRNRARVHLESGNVHEAQRDYERALSFEPAESPSVHLWRAEFHLANRRYQEAVQSFDLYERLELPDAQFYQGRGLAKAKLGDYAGAVEDYSRSLSLEPNTNVSARRGWAYALHPDELALHEFERSIKLNGKNLDAHAGYGFVLARLGRYREAVREAEIALPPGIKDWPMKSNVACIYAQASAKARDDVVSPDHLSLADRYREQAVRLIRDALELVADPKLRPGVWRTIAADNALDPIRASPEFARLETDFGTGPR
jgi:serine/threonine protein kinase/tetratricopeptide (TPR) repeat protein